MTDAHDIILYHGRRSADELVSASNAATVAAAMAHKELSLLHLGRVVTIVTSLADGIRHEPEAFAH